MAIALFVMKLMSRVFQTMIKAIARRTVIHFMLKYLFQLISRHIGYSGGKDHAFTFLNIYLKKAGYIEVLVKVVPPLLLFGIFNTPIPIGFKMKFILLVHLHKKFRITGIHARFNSIFNYLILLVHLIVFVRILPHTSKGQERSQS